MSFPNPKWQPAVSDTLDAAAAVDKGGGEVGLPITGHAFLAEQVVVIAGTTNYNGAYAINSKTANEIVITATYVAEVFAGTETVVFGRQPIVKADFLALEEAIAGQPSVRMQPPLVYVDAGTVRIEATADCPAEMAMTGLPNILNYNVQVDGGLSDSKIRSAVANVPCILGAGGLYGTTQTEKNSQWYLVYALAADADTDYELKAMPIMRVKSQTGQAIKCGTTQTPASGINYAFTDDDLAGGLVYFLTGDSKGLMRDISANDVDTDTRITYTGAALTVAVGDWFVVLPPATNFRMVGTFFNNSAGNIDPFRRDGNLVSWTTSLTLSGSGDVSACCPFATEAVIAIEGNGGGSPAVLPDWGGAAANTYMANPTNGFITGIRFPLYFCEYTLSGAMTAAYKYGYVYPPGCGY